MAHFVFVETSRPGITALEHAVRRGHAVTFIKSGKFDWVLRPADQQRLAQLPLTVVHVRDTQSPAALESALAALQSQVPVDAVLTVLQYCVAATALAAQALGLRATAAEGVLQSRDKAACRQRLQAHGVASIRFSVARSLDEALAFAALVGYPLIVKPSTGMGKVLTAIVRDEAALRRHFQDIEARRQTYEAGIQAELNDVYLLEELMTGPLYSVELATDLQGRRGALAIVRRKVGVDNPILEMGSTVPPPLDAQAYDEMEAYAIAVAEALGLDLGIVHMEVMGTSRGPLLVEVNPRIAGGSIPDLIKAASGRDLFETLVSLYEGQPLDTPRYDWHCVASHTVLGLNADCTVRSDLPADWFEKHRAALFFGSSDVTPGMALRRMDGNYDVYGILRVCAASYDEAVYQCRQVYDAIGEELQVELVNVQD